MGRVVAKRRWRLLGDEGRLGIGDYVGKHAGLFSPGRPYLREVGETDGNEVVGETDGNDGFIIGLWCAGGHDAGDDGMVYFGEPNYKISRFYEHVIPLWQHKL